MLYTITAVSPEVEDFAIELLIESDATFADLHALIRQTCGWEAFKPSTFYVCDHRWHRDRAIPEDSFEDDTMDEVELGDLLEDEGQRLQYIFDMDDDRGLLMEVSRIAYGKHIEEPVCNRRHGNAPELAPIATAQAPAQKTTADILAELNAAALNDNVLEPTDDDDLEPTDDELFDIEEIDLEGFDVTEE